MTLLSLIRAHYEGLSLIRAHYEGLSLIRAHYEGLSLIRAHYVYKEYLYIYIELRASPNKQL